MNKKLNLLLFCNKPDQASSAGTIIDHINAFLNYSSHNIVFYSQPGYYPPTLLLDQFDAVIIHYSSYLLNDFHITHQGKEHIKNFKGLKILFLQDEYRKINQFHDMIHYLGIDLLFTCIPESEIEKVYPTEKLPKLKKINTLTGYVPEGLLKLTPPNIAKRAIDVGYRARKLPYWYGKLAVEKWKIVDDFLLHTRDSGLQCDLSYSEHKRIYGKKWLKFVQNCKTMLGVESGASVLDFTGELEKEIEKYQAIHPFATFEEVSEKFLQDYDGKIKMNQISPRCFEAIALKTPLVLFEGDYSGILIAGKHYISLKKDFSNIQEVIKLIKDNDYLQQLADRAYQDIVINSNYTYNKFISFFDAIIENTIRPHHLSANSQLISQQQINKTLVFMPTKMKIRIKTINTLYAINNCLPYRLKQILRKAAHPVLKKLGVK